MNARTLAACLSLLAALAAATPADARDRDHGRWAQSWDDRDAGREDDRGRGRGQGRDERDRAQGRDERGGRDRGAERARLSLDEAVAMAERRYDARAVRAERRDDGGAVVYRIRLLGADGRVFNVTVDAASGDFR